MIRANLFTILLSTILLQFLPLEAAHSSGWWNWDCQKESLTSYWEEPIAGNELSGKGTVCASHSGLWSTMSVKGLTAGNAYTVWWVYIDNPAACVNFPLPSPAAIPFPEPANYAGRCGLADFFTPSESGKYLDPLVVYGRMDSVVASDHRRTRFSGDLRSFRPSSGSQVWMFIFGHGPADHSDTRQLARQLLTPEDPLSGTPHLGIEGRPFGYPAGVVVLDMK